jgi:hypothetical protein
MASTWSPLKIELIGTGDQSGTWGTTTNNNFEFALSEAITGSANVAFSSSDVTLTLTNSNTSQTARNLRLNLTGTSGGARQLILGSGCQINKTYIINNGLADAVTVKNTTGTGIAVPAGKTMFLFNNGTNVVEVITAINDLTASSNLVLPVGTTAQRPTPTSTGMVRFNTTDTQFEGYNGTAWTSIGGAQAGGAVYENKQSINANYTMSTNYNGESVGPITIAGGVTVTIPSGSRWVVL